jgi:hypothetical protein
VRDKARLLRDLLKLGVCFKTRLSEEDLSVYGEMVASELDDEQWAYAFRHYTAAWKDEAPKFMPTPPELIEAGRLCPKPPKPLTDEQREWRQRYFARQEERKRIVSGGQALIGPGSAGHLDLLRTVHDMPEKERPVLGESEWEQRKRELQRQADELLGAGECPAEKRQ